MAHKKPPLAGGVMAGGGQMGHSKKPKKPYMKNVNTISHDEENNMLSFNAVNE
jgi:hypothetical protein